MGLDDPDGTALQVSNMVRDSIKPDVTMFLHYKTIEEAGKKIIEINVQRGTDRPYYIAKKECARRVSMSGRAIPLFQPPIPQFAA